MKPLSKSSFCRIATARPSVAEGGSHAAGQGCLLDRKRTAGTESSITARMASTLDTIAKVQRLEWKIVDHPRRHTDPTEGVDSHRQAPDAVLVIQLEPTDHQILHIT